MLCPARKYIAVEDVDRDGGAARPAVCVNPPLSDGHRHPGIWTLSYSYRQRRSDPVLGPHRPSARNHPPRDLTFDLRTVRDRYTCQALASFLWL